MAQATHYTIWTNGRLMTMNPEINDSYGLLNHHDIITHNAKILDVLPNNGYTQPENATVIDLQDQLITPGFIDCHTHLIFAGNRAKEWEMRLNGMPYTDIAKQGGGINTTVHATRNSSQDELYALAYPRMLALANEGVTTLETKSGYGLDLNNERKQLLVAHELSKKFPIEIISTLLSAHTVPPEYKDHPNDYVDLICETIMPTLWSEQLFEAVDVFCESIGFSLEHTQKIFDHAKRLGIPVKGHMEQLSNLGGSKLTAQYNGLSVDHIEFLDEAAVQALSQSGTVATLLPLAFYFLRETQKPPIDLLRHYKVPMAISTDFNPGTSPFTSLRFAMNAASVQFGLTPLEVLEGVTRNAAQALGRKHSHGQLNRDYVANFAIWNVQDPVEIFYELGHNPLTHRVFHGHIQPTPLN